MTASVLRYAAFTDTAEGGNPAGVVLDASGLDEARMRAIAAEVGFAETAFLLSRGARSFDIRYFSPEVEVPFCGHATIATAVALAERQGVGPLQFHTRAGEVAVRTQTDGERITATLTSVAPYIEEPTPELVRAALAALDWSSDELDPSLPPRIGFAGARDLILAASTRARLAALDYDFDALRQLSLDHDLLSVVLVWRESPTLFHARSPFPVGGIVEDPATGSAAAAFGAYLRELRQIEAPARITIRQGEDMGRPSLLIVDIGESGGIRVTGQAVPM